MTARAPHLRFPSRAAAATALLVLAASLGGCADIGDSFASGAFVDPAKYDNFDCKQLETERSTLSTRTAELQGLMARADTATGGAVVVALAYRNDYISARAQARLAEEVWKRNKCVATSPAAAKPPAPAAAAPVPAKGPGSSARSGSGIY